MNQATWDAACAEIDDLKAKLAESDETIAELQATVDGFPVKLVFQPVQIDESVDELIYTKEKLEQAEQRVRELRNLIQNVANWDRRLTDEEYTLIYPAPEPKEKP